MQEGRTKEEILEENEKIIRQKKKKESKDGCKRYEKFGNTYVERKMKIKECIEEK